MRPAVAAVIGWVAIAVVGPTVAGDPITPLDGGPAALTLIAFSAALSMGTLLALRYRERRSEPDLERLVAPAPGFERIS